MLDFLGGEASGEEEAASEGAEGFLLDHKMRKMKMKRRTMMKMKRRKIMKLKILTATAGQVFGS